jgi:Domain of unknown function (DUF4395)
MSSTIFEFGQVRPEYAVPVLNERTVRAAAGILFFLAVISFMNAWLVGNFQPTRVFVVCFLIEFTIRIFINPRFAPVMILGEWMVRKQLPEWTGAPQKRFAWSIGFILAATMLYLVVFKNVIGPVNLIVCSLCLVLMFFETAFGICIGCKTYNLLNKEQAQLCPGGICEIPPGQISKMSMTQAAIVLAFFAVVFAIFQWIYSSATTRVSDVRQMTDSQSTAPVDPAEVERCKVPDFAKAMGHEEKWKLHNNCKY